MMLLRSVATEKMNTAGEKTIQAGQSLWRDAWRQLRLNRIAMVSFWIILAYLGLALYGEGVSW